MIIARRPWLAAVPAIALTIAVSHASAENAENELPTIDSTVEAPIAAILTAASPDVRRFNEHITTLANPFFEGRVPGSRGNDIAREYLAFWFDAFGLERPFTDGASEGSWEQPFPIGGRVDIVDQHLSISAPGEDRDRVYRFMPGEDYTATGLGGKGDVSGPPVFVGYGIDDGPQGYTNFAEDTDLTGSVAVMFRFEPMDQSGGSAFTRGGRWTDNASFSGKIASVASRGAEALIIINPPGSRDPRAERLISPRMSGGRFDLPVVHMTTEAGDTLLAMLDPQDRGAMDFRRLADEAETALAFPLADDDAPAEVRLTVDLETKPMTAYNVGGLLPGRGELADEIIVVGAHFDHIGDGGFGTPTSIEQTHNGADDNASGTAGILLMAEKLAERYAGLDDDADARSVLFLAFDAEESGLNGARYYVQNPIRPLDHHYLMVNFDMIGRVESGGLSVTGAQTAQGMADWLRPKFEASPLNIVQPTNVSRRSDHAPFYFEGEMPILFAIINPLHSDYHTAADLSYKINRFGAVQVVDLFEEIVLDAATRAQPLEVVMPAPQPPASRVLFGVIPRNAGEGIQGVLFVSVTPGSAADAAGVQPGDRLIEWDGEPVDTLTEWRWALAEHAPGDEVPFAVSRDGERVELSATLRGR